MLHTPTTQDWMTSSSYENLFADRSTTETIDFVKRLLAGLDIRPDDRLLYTACGNGEVVRGLSDLSVHITATDVSTERIAEALPHATERLHFYTHDPRLPFWSNYFDVALSLSSSFGGYRTVREHENVIRTIASSLKPGGIFVLDYLHATNELSKPGVDASSIADRFRRHTADGAHSETRLAFTADELKEMFARHQLTVQTIFGDDNLTPFNEEKASRLIIVTQKAQQKQEDREKRLYSDGRTGDALT